MEKYALSKPYKVTYKASYGETYDVCFWSGENFYTDNFRKIENVIKVEQVEKSRDYSPEFLKWMCEHSKGLDARAKEGYKYPSKGQIVKIHNQKDEYIAIYDGEKFLIPKASFKEDQVEWKSTKGISEETKTLLKNYLKKWEAIVKLEEKKKKINNEIEEEIEKIEESIKTYKDDYSHSLGLLSQEEFIEEFKANLSDKVKEEIKRYDYYYGMSKCGGGSYYIRSINIFRDVDIEKWYNGPLVYEEYDHTRHIEITKQNKKEFDSYINRYSKPLSVKMDSSPNLILGDKDWLSFYQGYSIEIKKPKTKEYAKQLAKEFCKN